MARISKDAHPRILQMVDSEHRKVAEVAAEYGCTPANIYALLSKLRREIPPAVEAPSTHQDLAERPSAPVVEERLSSKAVEASAQVIPDLFALGPKNTDAPGSEAKIGRRRTRPAANDLSAVDVKPPENEPTPEVAAPASQEPQAVSPLPTRSVVTQLPAPGPVKNGGGLGAKLAKPGMALMMRTAEGDENLTPFRSLDDLLSAVKPILRAAARSPDAVWFSIQPVDLASLDSDAA